MHLDDGTAEPQSHAHALRLGGFEQAEYIVRTLSRDPWAIVFHLQVQVITQSLAPYAQLRLATSGLGQRIDGVVEQVQNDLLQLRGIAMHAQVGIPIDRAAHAGMVHFRLDQVQHILHHLKPTGRAGIVLANGSMSSSQNSEGQIRAAMVEADVVEVKNAVENTAKEIGTRFDFKGTSAAIELKDKDITLIGDSDFQLQQIDDILRNKLAKRNVDVRFLDKGDVQKIGGDKVKQVVKVREGIASEDAKKIQRLIKDSKLKVQAAIQGESVRVTGAKRDDLQAAMALIRKDMTDLPLTFDNFRD